MKIFSSIKRNPVLCFLFLGCTLSSTAHAQVSPRDCVLRQQHYQNLELQRQLYQRAFWFDWLVLKAPENSLPIAIVGRSAGSIGVGVAVSGFAAMNAPVFEIGLITAGVGFGSIAALSGRERDALPFLACAQTHQDHAAHNPFWSSGTQRFLRAQYPYEVRLLFGEQYAQISRQMTRFREQSLAANCRLDFESALRFARDSECWRRMY